MLFKLCHQLSFDHIASLFALKHRQIVSDVFYKHLIHQFHTNCNIPIILQDDQVNQDEVDKLLERLGWWQNMMMVHI